jgi:hypothetical protein
VRAKKANACEPLMKCRKETVGVETGGSLGSRDESGGCLPTGQTASGIEAARAWFGILCGTCVNLRPDGAAGQWSGCGLRLVVWSENSERLKPRGGE